MSHEIEVKLAVSAETFNQLAPYLQQLNPLEKQSIFLSNTYYDYPDHFLAKQKMGLRIRQEDEKVTLTLKTNGNVVGGLHERPEYNLALAENTTPTHEQLRALYPFEQLPDAPLQPIFSTDFNRTFWLIAFRDAQIEVAFDQGKIISGDRAQPICEIEFELKEGNIQDLFDFIETLPFSGGVYFSSASKAQRGYQLGQPQELKNWLDVNRWAVFFGSDKNTINYKVRFHDLLKIEQELVEETLSLSNEILIPKGRKIIELIGAFFNLYGYYCSDNNELLESVITERDEMCCEKLNFLLESNEYLFNTVSKLMCLQIETVKRKDLKENEKIFQNLAALFKTRHYFERMIKLMQLVA